MPPSRFRVVEQGRRLVVIDTLADEVEARPTPAAVAGRSEPSGLTAKLQAALAAKVPLQLPKQTRFDGTATLVTHPLYDDKGPRTLSLDPGAMQLLSGAKTVGIGAAVFWVLLGVFFPVLFVVPLLLLLPGVATPLRARLTGWLDRFAA